MDVAVPLFEPDALLAIELLPELPPEAPPAALPPALASVPFTSPPAPPELFTLFVATFRLAFADPALLDSLFVVSELAPLVFCVPILALDAAPFELLETVNWPGSVVPLELNELGLAADGGSPVPTGPPGPPLAWPESCEAIPFLWIAPVIWELAIP